ncbi:jg20471, partial [Pararge aegeria aegeria]
THVVGPDLDHALADVPTPAADLAPGLAVVAALTQRAQGEDPVAAVIAARVQGIDVLC